MADPPPIRRPSMPPPIPPARAPVAPAAAKTDLVPAQDALGDETGDVSLPEDTRNLEAPDAGQLVERMLELDGVGRLEVARRRPARRAHARAGFERGRGTARGRRRRRQACRLERAHRTRELGRPTSARGGAATPRARRAPPARAAAAARGRPGGSRRARQARGAVARARARARR